MIFSVSSLKPKNSSSLPYRNNTGTGVSLDSFPIILREATDERNFVKKAVNWALRQIGKRNVALNKEAIKTAEKIKKIQSKSARWIAADAIRELRSQKIQERLQNFK
ncbi:DNA alkylation repair protein [Candidatus Woesearchaeota archaeon]|nr:DNA alkylation repair protein [Candidatus Woesearchaeota archaeon]